MPENKRATVSRFALLVPLGAIVFTVGWLVLGLMGLDPLRGLLTQP